MLNNTERNFSRKIRYHSGGQVFIEFILIMALMAVVLLEVEVMIKKSRKEIKKTEVSNEVRNSDSGKNEAR